MNKPHPARALANTLHMLEQELLAATDEEVLQVAAAIGLKPDRKGSIALAGFSTTVLPATSAELVRPIMIAPGKFHGGMIAPTPSGI